MIRPRILNAIERKVIILLGDLFIILSSLNVFINDALDEKVESLFYRTVFYISGVLIYLFISYILDFYNLEKSIRRRLIFSQSIYIVGSFVLTIFIATVIFFDASFWRIPLIVFLVLTPFAIFMWRLFFRSLFNIIPATKNVLYIHDYSDKTSQEKIIGLIDGQGKQTYYKTKLTFSLRNIQFLQKGKFIDAIDKVDCFILNLQNYDKLSLELESILLNSILRGKEVISFTSFYENIYEALPIESHNDSFYEILQLKNLKIRYFQAIFTFLVNWVLILIVGLVFVLVLPFVFILNLFFNKGPLFYTQKRVGQFGNEFTIYKFRSMVVDAEKAGAKMATKNDSRITAFGKTLRVFRIDELPQIISVVKGDMQFIGPRPERRVFVDQLNKIIPFYNARHLIKPGITGWAQVKYKYGENLEDSIKKLEYDLYYIKNKSIMLDIKIVFKTITTVLFSRGI
jgi:lipopolysaccharide/colanic/teichoic acid biosynthesis glycosyltransferase